MLRYTLVFAIVVCLLAPVAQADLSPGDPLTIIGGEPGIQHWGTGIFGGGTHPFAGVTFYSENLPDGIGEQLLVISEAIFPPSSGEEVRSSY